MSMAKKENSGIIGSGLRSVQKQASSLRAWAKKRPLLATAAGVGGALLIAVAVVAAVPSLRAHVSDSFGPKTLAELRKKAQEQPKAYEVQRALGHGQFENGNRIAALHAYDRALALDVKAADDKMISNLVACYGFLKEQPEAAALIARYKLNGATKQLQELAHNKRHGTRWGAIYTLERLDHASHGEFVTAWAMDLDEKDCDIRRHAVEKLGESGGKHVIPALHAAKKKDHDETPWYRRSCLGSRTDDAEKLIVARDSEKEKHALAKK